MEVMEPSQVDTVLVLPVVMAAVVMVVGVAERGKGLLHLHPLRVVFFPKRWRSWGIIIATISTQPKQLMNQSE
jgi:hypothetical protein